MAAEYAKRVQENYCCAKCTPGKRGTRVMQDTLARIVSGHGEERDLATIESIAGLLENCKCTLCMTSAVPVLDTVKHFRDDYFAYIRGERKPKPASYKVKLTAPCQDKCPAHIDIPAYIETIKDRRTLVDEGQWEKALQRWPGHLADERKLLAAIVQSKGQLDPVFKVLDKKLKNFFVSAFQSALFNELLTQRLDTINYIEKGDIAYLHRNGAAFLVTEPIAEQPRVDSFEISPSGPLFGPKLLVAEELPGQREQACLAKHALTLEDFKIPGLKLRGGRRPYRFIIKNTKVDWAAEVLSVSFELPPGAYATVVMAELMKPKP
jgi:hypothetical protein